MVRFEVRGTSSLQALFKLSLDMLRTEAAIEGVQASVDAFKLLSGGWCLKIEIVIVFGNI